MRYLAISSFVLALAVPLAATAQHVHDSHAATGKLQLNHGKKWRTDAPLRSGMAAMRMAAVDTIDKVHAGKATDQTFDATAKVVEQQLAHIVKNCKLPPAADAQLHIVIADVMAANEAVAGKPGQQQSRTSGVVALARALNAYGAHFDDPSFKPIDLSH